MTLNSLLKKACLTMLFAVGVLGASALAQGEGQTAPPSVSGGAGSGGAVLIPSYAPVTDARLLNPEPQNWLIYKGSYKQQGYSPLDQITTDNVSNLVPVWAYSIGETDAQEGAPIVNNGIMFATGTYNTLFALDATTGEMIWSYKRDLPQDVYPVVCCGVVNRGVALYGNNVYMVTLDDHVLAFDAKTGKIVWDTTVADYTKGYAMTVAPLAVKGKIIVGVTGGEYGVRGFIEAFDAETGKSDWKTYTTAAPDQPGGDTWPGDTYEHGGAPIWVTGSYDPSTNLTYWGTGNAAPYTWQVRPGDNLYVSSVVALDVDTGQIEAHYQYNPNDSWDYDAISDQTLVTIDRNGQKMEGLIHAGRNGIFYLLNRGDNLKFVYGVPFAKSEETITGFTDDGRPIVPDDRKPAINKTIFTCPFGDGANNWYGLSYNPNLGYAFIPTTEWCMSATGQSVVYQAGKGYTGQDWKVGPPPGYDRSSNFGALQAIDVATGKVVWRDDQSLPVRSASLTTKGGLVFVGDVGSREFRAYDAKTGKELWHFKASSGVTGVPTSFEVDGVQYIAVESGVGGELAFDFGPVAEYVSGRPWTPAQGGAIWVFALRNQQGTGGQSGGAQ